MLAVFAQFETDVRRERQAEGSRGRSVPASTPRISRQAALDALAAGDVLGLLPGRCVSRACRSIGSWRGEEEPNETGHVLAPQATEPGKC